MRLTRAQLRAQTEDVTPPIHEDDEAIAQSTYSESGPDNAAVRPVLKDITEANSLKLIVEESIEEMSAKRAKGKKGGKKNAKKNMEVIREPEESTGPEILEDDNQSDSSKAVLVAAELAKDNPIAEKFHVPLETDQPQTSTSAAVSEATRTLSLSPNKNTDNILKTPRFEPDEHKPPTSIQTSEQDSFIGSIRKTSPFKLPMSQEHQDISSDSFVEQITSRTPSKPMARIEDSVEAIDALEDAIEQISGELPLLTGRLLQSPTKKTSVQSSPRRESPKTKTSHPSASKSASKSPIKGRTPLPSSTISQPHKLGQTRKPSVRQSIKPTATRPSTANARPAPAAPNSTLAATHQISFSKSPAKPRANMTHKRVPGSIAFTSKAPFVPTKSTKPPTKSTFTLPGDAVAAKLKAEREERQKREESAEKMKPTKPTGPSIQPKRATNITTKSPRKPSFQLPGDAVAAKLKAQREARAEREASAQAEKSKAAKSATTTPAFKAKPAPSRPRPSVVPRENKASQARASLMHSTGPNKENVAPKPKTAGQQIEVAKIRRRTNGTIATPGQVTTGAARTAANIASRRSISAQQQQQRAASESNNKLMMTMTKMEKEEAAKKARAEAAEQGRQASREWAERQKMKLAAARGKGTEGAEKKGEAAVVV